MRKNLKKLASLFLAMSMVLALAACGAKKEEAPASSGEASSTSDFTPSQMNYLAFRDIITDFYDYRYIQEATMIMISQKTWDKLLPEDQETITNIINDICAKGAEQAESACDEYMDKLEAEGIRVHTFTDEELSAFAESCRTNVWPQLAKNYPDGWLDQVKESVA